MENYINKVIQGDCLEVMKGIPDKSIDSIVTDPPYELGFMGKSWDNTGIANSKEMWAECLRVLKPGGYLLSFGGTRTYHRMAYAIEDAGFEVRDMIEWVYGSGFPKSTNIAIRIDKEAGKMEARGKGTSFARKDMDGKILENGKSMPQHKGITDEAKQWEGWGTALKPAHEPICMARKHLAEKTVAENCLKYGTGGINIDGSRVGTEDTRQKTGGAIEGSGWGTKGGAIAGSELGRFPANLIHDNSEEVIECFPNESERFFKSIIYTAKASKSERNKGIDVVEDNNKRPQGEAFGDDSAITGHSRRKGNFHPTVKPVSLMEYLIKMVTPKGGVVLDPFAGSGTTGVACKNLNRNYILIEKEPEYIEIIKKRLNEI